MNFLMMCVILSFLMCVVFAVVILLFSYWGIEVPESLIQYFYMVFGLEFGSAAAIQIAKYVINKKKVKDKIDLIKENDLTVDKKDLSPDKNVEDGYFYDDSDDGILG